MATAGAFAAAGFAAFGAADLAVVGLVAAALTAGFAATFTGAFATAGAALGLAAGLDFALAAGLVVLTSPAGLFAAAFAVVTAGFAVLAGAALVLARLAVTDGFTGIVSLATLTSPDGFTVVWFSVLQPKPMLLNNPIYGERQCACKYYIDVNVKLIFAQSSFCLVNSSYRHVLGAKLPRFASTKHRPFLHSFQTIKMDSPWKQSPSSC
ncbi:hypothetical protein HB779_05260 [Phyllobacterium sp. 628]|uniref:hypothetical protein n=1 Tax=Phyllobacterium sp. 628 TaxID=2718938 RepID=UPI00166279B8|nr:hypothetical protein [Phyllobacterium sp. 628]QND51371.1 hypothetical protein HB779_05260 [Phyllobacterium sp. 628]